MLPRHVDIMAIPFGLEEFSPCLPVCFFQPVEPNVSKGKTFVLGFELKVAFIIVSGFRIDA